MTLLAHLYMQYLRVVLVKYRIRMKACNGYVPLIIPFQWNDITRDLNLIGISIHFIIILSSERRVSNNKNLIFFRNLFRDRQKWIGISRIELRGSALDMRLPVTVWISVRGRYLSIRKVERKLLIHKHLGFVPRNLILSEELNHL